MIGDLVHHRLRHSHHNQARMMNFIRKVVEINVIHINIKYLPQSAQFLPLLHLRILIYSLFCHMLDEILKGGISKERVLA